MSPQRFCCIFLRQVSPGVNPATETTAAALLLRVGDRSSDFWLAVSAFRH